MATNNMHNFTTLVKRLEAATARLEDIASSTVDLPPPNSYPSGLNGSAGTKSAPPEDLPESIEEFDTFINTSVNKYVQASNKLGGVIADQAAKVLEGFKQQRRFLLITTKAKKPDVTGTEMAAYQDLIKPINEALMAVSNIKDANRGSPCFNQLSAVAEGMIMLAWVTIDKKPHKHVDESLQSGQFFGDRVLKEYKDKDPDQVAWVQAFYGIFRDLTEYVKRNFPIDIPWNSKGLPAAEVAKTIPVSGSSAPVSTSAPAPPPPPPPGGAGAPPPPPPGPPPVFQLKEKAAAAPAPSSGFGALFSELNKGESVTMGLRKVDRSEMTHKNPELRASSTVSDTSSRGKSSAPGKRPKPESMRVKKPPHMALEDKKWTIENYEKHPEPIEIEASINQLVLISKCSHTTVIIKGKANAVTVENTQRLSLVVDSLVSTVDVVKSSNFALQILGAVPTVLLDQLDGAQVYLSKDSSSTRIFSSKSAGVNLNVITSGEDEEDYKELPLPSQICSHFNAEKGELVNEVVDLAG